jgi:hypothetical protein
MNPTEIFEALDALGKAPYDANELPFAFAEATDNAKATIAKLRNGTTNKSDIQGGVLLNGKFHFAPALPGMAEAVLDEMKGSKRTARAKPAILFSSDGEFIAAEQGKTAERVHFPLAEFGDHFSFFLPAAGKDRYRAADENPVDIKAAGKLAKLYDALLRRNPEWDSQERRHEMNLFMTRLIFCMFAEDVNIFPENQFSHALFSYSGNRGEEAHQTIKIAFTAMSRPKGERTDLPPWSQSFEYVNGGLFAGQLNVPEFDVVAFRYLRDACDMNWKLINPDIFGSMIQSIADRTQRSELGMHYTSVPNIMKVLGPLFLDELDEAIERAWEKSAGLKTLLARLSHIRVFDPACGSGNFLVVAYRELRDREIRILIRLGDLDTNPQNVMFSSVPLNNFYGIELNDFAAETAKLALFIAEYQANARMADVFGIMPALLPLREGGNIVRGDSLTTDWTSVCPRPSSGEEVYIAGNPPFAGAKNQTAEQKAARNAIFEARKIKSYKTLDLVAAWFVLATDYIQGNDQSRFAFVATSSLTQGRQVPSLWPYILKSLVIGFAHRPFKWRNNASANAAVDCVIVGVRHGKADGSKLYEADIVTNSPGINAYLISGPLLFVKQQSKSLFDLPQMIYGAMPNDGGGLILSPTERDQMLSEAPSAHEFIRPLVGTTELIESTERFCLWIEDADKDRALAIPQVAERVALTRAHRLASDNQETVDRAESAHRFWHPGGASRSHSIIVASASSERREVLPCDRRPADTVASNLCFVIHDGPDWVIALITSRLHLTWIAAVCGKLEARYRYSSTLGWHTFPVPKFSAEEHEALSASARAILRVRYAHYPATIAELYDPKKMPPDLRSAHAANDELVETMYIGRSFRNDTERLETLFKLYAAKARKGRK